METMPPHLAALALTSWDGGIPPGLGACGRSVGSNVEIDLGLVSERVDPLLAQHLSRYSQSCREFWETYFAGGSPGEYVAVRREVFRDKQRDTKSEKRFLVPQIRSADQVGGLSEFLEELLREAPDDGALETLGAPLGFSLTQEGHWRTVRLSIETDNAWPAEWGGLGTHAEVRRHVTLTTSHAKSKGRHSERRLVEVVVEAEEIWPRP